MNVGGVARSSVFYHCEHEGKNRSNALITETFDRADLSGCRLTKLPARSFAQRITSKPCFHKHLHDRIRRELVAAQVGVVSLAEEIVLRRAFRKLGEPGCGDIGEDHFF